MQYKESSLRHRDLKFKSIVIRYLYENDIVIKNILSDLNLDNLLNLLPIDVISFLKENYKLYEIYNLLRESIIYQDIYINKENKRILNLIDYSKTLKVNEDGSILHTVLVKREEPHNKDIEIYKIDTKTLCCINLSFVSDFIIESYTQMSESGKREVIDSNYMNKIIRNNKINNILNIS